MSTTMSTSRSHEVGMQMIPPSAILSPLHHQNARLARIHNQVVAGIKETRITHRKKNSELENKIEKWKGREESGPTDQKTK